MRVLGSAFGSSLHSPTFPYNVVTLNRLISTHFAQYNIQHCLWWEGEGRQLYDHDLIYIVRKQRLPKLLKVKENESRSIKHFNQNEVSNREGSFVPLRYH